MTYLENWGSGAKRIIDACRAQNVDEPTWSDNGGFITVTFKRPVNKDSNIGDAARKQQAEPLNHRSSMTQVHNLGGNSALSTPQVPPKHPLSTPQVELLSEKMGDSYMTMKEIAELCGVKDLKYFRESYIAPALEARIIERLYPNHPKHPKQKYRKTKA